MAQLNDAIDPPVPTSDI